MLSQTTEYAMRAMAIMAMEPDRVMSTPELARATRAPQNYLAKVLQQLAGAGLVNGRRGIGGGYRLARPSNEVRLIEIINAVTTLQRIESCPLGLPNHGTNLCALHRLLDRVAQSMIEIFDDNTLADLVGEEGRRRPLCDADGAAPISISAPPGKRAS